MFATLILAALTLNPAFDLPAQAEAATIDGRLDDSVWDGAVVLDGFTAVKPVEGATPSQPTRVRMYRDRTHLYIGIDAYDSEPAKIRATLSDRDAIFNDDVVFIGLDPFGDARRGFLFGVNAHGIQADGVHMDGGNEDFSWDAVFASAGRIDDAGYTIEVAIPFASIRYDPSVATWGLHIVRVIPRKGEQVSWAPIHTSNNSLFKQAGQMHGMDGIPTGTVFEIVPEITAASPTNTLHGAAGAFGVSAKLARGSHALDLAVNPDFSQIESDPSQINLNRRFALYLQEKRPFFLEARELFSTPIEAVYTRSIANPLYGLKASGQSGSTTYAALHALDEQDGAYATAARSMTTIKDKANLGFIATDRRAGDTNSQLAGVDGHVDVTKSIRVTGQALRSSTGTESGGAYRLDAHRSGRHFQASAWAKQIDPGFRAQLGFVPRVGYKEAGVDAGYRFETGNKSGLIAVRPSVMVRGLDAAGGDSERFARARINFDYGKGGTGLSARTGREVFAGREFTVHGVDGDGGVQLTKWLSFGAGFYVGDTIAYFSADDPYKGSLLAAGAGVGLQPSSRISLSLSYSREIFRDAYDASVLRGQTQLFFTQDLSVRIIGDYDNVSNEVRASALAAYRPGPGTVVYVGYQNDGVFLKLSYLFRR